MKHQLGLISLVHSWHSYVRSGADQFLQMTNQPDRSYECSVFSDEPGLADDTMIKGAEDAPGTGQDSDTESTTDGGSDSSGPDYDEPGDGISFGQNPNCTNRSVLSQVQIALAKCNYDDKMRANGFCQPTWFKSQCCADSSLLKWCNNLCDNADRPNFSNKPEESDKELETAPCLVAYPGRVARVFQSGSLSPKMKIQLCQLIHNQCCSLEGAGDFVEYMETVYQQGPNKISL